MSTANRSIIDLVVLGMLLKESMNAYLVVQYTQKRNVTRMVKLSAPAIYKSCRRLFEQGYLKGEVWHEGEAPEKVTYAVTARGRKHFKELMTHFASKQLNYFFDINSVVYCLEQLDYEQGLVLIDSYIFEADAMRSWLVEHLEEVNTNASFGARMIVKQYLMVAETLLKWAAHLREEFSRERSNELDAHR